MIPHTLNKERPLNKWKESSEVKILLTVEEATLAMQVALLRQRDALVQGRRETFDPNKTWKDGLDVHWYGVCAEIAVARFLDLYCPLHVNQYKGMAADIGKNIEVRWTRNESNGLVIRPDDPDDRWYYLVVGEPLELTVVGLIQGKEGKNEFWKKDPGNRGREAYFVPASELAAPN